MALTDKEIALELTKAYLEHLNTRVNNNGMKSYAEADFIVGSYKLFYKTVSQLGESTKGSDK